jgi:hypothetical protein
MSGGRSATNRCRGLLAAATALKELSRVLDAATAKEGS